MQYLKRALHGVAVLIACALGYAYGIHRQPPGPNVDPSIAVIAEVHKASAENLTHANMVIGAGAEAAHELRQQLAMLQETVERLEKRLAPMVGSDPLERFRVVPVAPKPATKPKPPAKVVPAAAPRPTAGPPRAATAQPGPWRTTVIPAALK